MIYDYFRVTGIHDSVENYADLFTISLRNDDIQEFDSKWDGILLSMTKIPPDDILEGLCKLRIRESEKLKTVLGLYDLEIHQKKSGPDYHRLKTMVKRSIEQDIRNKNFGIRNGNYGKNAVVKNQGTKQRVQRISILTGASVSRRLRAEFTTRAASLFEDEKIFHTASLSVLDAVVPSLRRHSPRTVKEDREKDHGRRRRTRLLTDIPRRPTPKAAYKGQKVVAMAMMSRACGPLEDAGGLARELAFVSG